MTARTAVVVVQARMGSARFPGKVLADLAGLPMLPFLLRRLAPLVPSCVPHLVVATTRHPRDDAVAAAAEDAGAAVVRGPEEDVLARFVAALDRFPADAVVRVTADCPLLDPALISAALTRFWDTGVDYVSNSLVRTFPDGLDVEVVSTRALQAAAHESDDPVEREHVTPFVYRRPERFRLRSLRSSTPRWSALRLTVDTEDDLERLRTLVEPAGGVRCEWTQVAAALERAEGVGAPAGLALRPACAEDSAFVLTLRNDPDSVRWSRSAAPVDVAGHETWFRSRLEDPGSRIWIAVERDQPVGQIRVDVASGVGLVSVNVAADARGRGVGTHVIELLERALAMDEQVHTLRAEIHAENEASRRAFARRGFTARDEDGAFTGFEKPRRPRPPGRA